MAQRALRPPRSARVHTRASGQPASVALDSGRAGGRVLQAAGPWRFFGEWWGDAPFARDYWDVELSDGGVYRLYHDLAHGGWFVDGIYD
jgi:protein ImuB